jgi:hypothetical protein
MPARLDTLDESFLVLFYKKEPLASAKARKRFFLKKEAKTFILGMSASAPRRRLVERAERRRVKIPVIELLHEDLHLL